MAEYLCCSPKTITALFVNQLCPNTKFKKRKKKKTVNVSNRKRYQIRKEHKGSDEKAQREESHIIYHPDFESKRGGGE